MNKNIVLCVILSIVTCGIYGLYWMYTLNESARTVNPNEWQMEGVLAVVLTIVTCGLYGWYWLYRCGDALDQLRYSQGERAGYLGILYLLLGVFSLGIISYALMQVELNSYADY